MSTYWPFGCRIFPEMAGSPSIGIGAIERHPAKRNAASAINNAALKDHFRSLPNKFQRRSAFDNSSAEENRSDTSGASARVQIERNLRGAHAELRKSVSHLPFEICGSNSV